MGIRTSRYVYCRSHPQKIAMRRFSFCLWFFDWRLWSSSHEWASISCVDCAFPISWKTFWINIILSQCLWRLILFNIAISCRSSLAPCQLLLLSNASSLTCSDSRVTMLERSCVWACLWRHDPASCWRTQRFIIPRYYVSDCAWHLGLCCSILLQNVLRRLVATTRHHLFGYGRGKILPWPSVTQTLEIWTKDQAKLGYDNVHSLIKQSHLTHHWKRKRAWDQTRDSGENLAADQFELTLIIYYILDP